MFFKNYSTLDYKTASTLDIKSKISKLVNLGKPEQDFLFASINDWEASDTKKLMVAAQHYYVNENEINERERYYLDRKGAKVKAENVSNSKLSHPYLRKLVNQKINRLLSKELSIQTDDDNLAKLLGEYLNSSFLSLLKNVGKQSIVNAISWMQVYYDAQGNLKYKRIPSEELIPFWADADHTELEAIIRTYAVTNYLPEGVKQVVHKVEYHTTAGVWYYIVGPSGLEPDPDKGADVLGHFTISQPTLDDKGMQQLDENGNPITETVNVTWERVPFIAFKYNSEEISLLKLVKPLIDDYDINTSDTSNNLQDIPNSIKIVKDFDGTDKGEFTHNLNVFRTAFVAGTGDMTALETNLDVAAMDSHLNRLRKDIYDCGSGVDMQEAQLGTTSGIALKLRFNDLDADVEDLATEFRAALDNLLWFIKIDLINKGKGDYLDIPVEIIFNTDTLVNETEVITSARDSVGIISNETIVANHPWVTDAKAEMDRLKKEKAEALKDMQDMLKVESQFGQDNNTPPVEEE